MPKILLILKLFRGGGVLGTRKGGRDICFDEAFLKNLERMQWDRNNSFV